MEWADEGIVLSTRRHGETGSIVELMTRAHGRHAGRIHGQKVRSTLPSGTRVLARWRGRLAEHLGAFTLEPVHNTASRVIGDPGRLAALVSACALVEAALPERAVSAPIHDGLAAMLDALEGEHWAASYVLWELGLLGALGFGLDLERCAATGRNDQLAYVSPRTGRAVSRSAGEAFHDRLLPLPGFMSAGGPDDPAEVLAGLALTGHFLERSAFAQGAGGIPPARARFVDRYRRAAAAGTRPPDPTAADAGARRDPAILDISATDRP